MSKFLTAVFAMVAAVTAMAQSQVQIELNGSKNDIAFKPGAYPSEIKLNVKNDGEILLCSGGKLTRDWVEYEFTFTPSKSGQVDLILRGPKGNTEENPIWIGYDNLKVIGAELKNPDFEEQNENGEFNGWSGNITNLLRSVPDAQTGRNYIRVKYDLPASQSINVTAGQPITVKFNVKAVDSPVGF